LYASEGDWHHAGMAVDRYITTAAVLTPTCSAFTAS
jgi:hypothetical protein